MHTLLSYLMGAGHIQDNELETLGIKIVRVTDSGIRKLEIPEQSLQQYIGLVKERLEPDYWNEVIGPEKILFVFKFKDGHVEEYVLSEKSEQQIDRLCADFNDEPPEKTANVYKYLSENDFYHDVMHRYYADMIARG